MVAVWLAAIVPAVAVNVAVVLPDATVTEAGTVNAAALLDMVAAAPAVFDKVTVHVATAPDIKFTGLHVKLLTTVGTSEIAAVCVLPFNVAVMVAVWLAAIVPAVAVNVAVGAPSTPTAIETGTVNAATLLDSVTVAPPVLDTVAVQMALALDPRLVGVHVNPVSNTGAISEIVAVCVLPFSVAVMGRGLVAGDRPGCGCERGRRARRAYRQRGWNRQCRRVAR